MAFKAKISVISIIDIINIMIILLFYLTSVILRWWLSNQARYKILSACWYLWCWWSLSSCGVLGVIMRLKTKTVTWGHIHHQHTDRAVKTPQQDPPVFLSSTGGAQCKHNCNYHKMERFQWAQLGSTKPAILVKSLGKYFLVQVKEFPAGQASDKVYEEGGNIVLKTELASFRLRHASQSSVRSQSSLPDTTSRNIRWDNFQSDYNDRLVDSGIVAWPPWGSIIL